jgi:methylglutaconyl-CoA hydratase
MPMNQPLSLHREGTVARLRLDRPEVHNAFDDGLVAALTRTLESLVESADVRVLVHEGAGASFSAGADLNWMRGMAAASEAENRDDALALARLMRTLDAMPMPTIARVHGAAFGGGVGLVACCDIAIGTPAAKFGLTESRLGLLPAVISPYVIAAIGARQARRLFITGEVFDGEHAARIGLLHTAVPLPQLDEAMERVEHLLNKVAPQAQREAKRLALRVGGIDHAQVEAQDRANAELIARLRVGEEGQHGLAAFLDKRPPRWVTQ